MRSAVKHGAATLGTLAEQAIRRYLEKPGARRLFSDQERAELGRALAATNSTAELLGRSRIRRRLEQAEKHAEFSEATDFSCFDESPIHPLSPLRALAWFKKLIPGLRPDSEKFAAAHERQGFNLAVTTEKTLLQKVKDLIARALETGQRIRQTPKAIEHLLDDAGVSPRNPQYAEMAFRTNMMSAYNRGAHEEMQDPDVAPHFPVWRYVGIRDGRQGKDHEPHFDRYYPNSASFEEVRGPRVYNCRCTSIPIYKKEWARLQSEGASVSKFAEHDVTGEPRDASGKWTAGGGGESAKTKPKATRGEMSAARREGKGKDARIVLADGSAAPAHIKPSMIPPQWSDVKISTDPHADVLVQAKDKKGNAKTVYSDNWNMKAQAAKFARIHDALHEMPDMAAQVQKDRQDPKKAGAADCTWLMQEQGTRPGSEADNKGVSKYFGHKLNTSDVQIGEKDKAGVPKVALKIGDEEVPIKDKKARAELARRIDAGEPLHDSTYWLKSHGATTLQGRHVVETKDGVRLQFMGKESVWHDHLIRNPKLASMLLERKKAAGDGGKLFGVSDGQVSAYAKTLDHGGFSPKDWRTAKATRMAIDEINKMDAPKTEKEYKTAAMSVAKKVSGVLGNEPAQALESYISPTVFSGWRANVA